MKMQTFRSFVGVSVIYLILVGLSSACGTLEATKLDSELSNVQLTPTMHIAFQLTPASEKMADPVPVEGFGMYEIDGLGGGGEKQEVVEIETAVSQLHDDAQYTELLDGSGNSGNTLVEGTLPDNANELVVNQVVVVTPRPQSPPPVKPVATANTAQPVLTTTPVPAAVNDSSSMVIGDAKATVSPTPICGGNHYHEVGLANQVDQMPIGFEEFGSWMRSEDTYGALLQTNLLSKSGQNAAWLCYFFNTPEDETAVFKQIHPIPGQPNTVRMWVYGNRSAHFLGVWILDKERETWLIPLGPILHEGWEVMEATFVGPNAVPLFYISGPSNDRIDFPILFRGISLNDSPDEAITYGGVVIDEINFITK